MATEKPLERIADELQQLNTFLPARLDDLYSSLLGITDGLNEINETLIDKLDSPAARNKRFETVIHRLRRISDELSPQL